MRLSFMPAVASSPHRYTFALPMHRRCTGRDRRKTKWCGVAETWGASHVLAFAALFWYWDQKKARHLKLFNAYLYLVAYCAPSFTRFAVSFISDTNRSIWGPYASLTRLHNGRLEILMLPVRIYCGLFVLKKRCTPSECKTPVRNLLLIKNNTPQGSPILCTLPSTVSLTSPIQKCDALKSSPVRAMHPPHRLNASLFFDECKSEALRRWSQCIEDAKGRTELRQGVGRVYTLFISLY